MEWTVIAHQDNQFLALTSWSGANIGSRLRRSAHGRTRSFPLRGLSPLRTKADVIQVSGFRRLSVDFGLVHCTNGKATRRGGLIGWMRPRAAEKTQATHVCFQEPPYFRSSFSQIFVRQNTFHVSTLPARCHCKKGARYQITPAFVRSILALGWP